MKKWLLLIAIFLPFATNAQSFDVTQSVVVDAGGDLGEITINYTKIDTDFCISEFGDAPVWNPSNECGYIWSNDIDNSAIDGGQIQLSGDDTYILPVQPRPYSGLFYVQQTDLSESSPKIPFYSGTVTFTFLYGVNFEQSSFSITFDNNGDLVEQNNDNWLGIPSATVAMSYVTDGVRETGSNTLPIATTLVGVPIAFIIGRAIILFIRSGV